MRKIILYIFASTVLAFGFSNTTFAQRKVRQEVRKGNKAFQKESYNDAEIAYRKALSIAPTDSTAMYNLAATLLQTERGEEAFDLYKRLTEVVKRGNSSADVHHNIGVMLMAQKKYAEAIELYKESLRARPTDNDTRYNLILAQKLLQQENKGGGENQDKNQEQQDKKEQNQNKEKPNEDQQENDKKDRAQEKPSEAQEKMSKDNAEKILKAFLEDEKKTQEKVNKAQSQHANRKRADKNW